jgi:hypothetical protein
MNEDDDSKCDDLGHNQIEHEVDRLVELMQSPRRFAEWWHVQPTEVQERLRSLFLKVLGDRTFEAQFDMIQRFRAIALDPSVSPHIRKDALAVLMLQRRR